MLSGLKTLRNASWKDAAVLIAVGFIVLFFIATSFETAIHLGTFVVPLIAAVFLFVLIVWAGLVAAMPAKEALRYARLCFVPSIIFLLLIPYNFFYLLPHGVRPVSALIIVIAGIFLFSVILRQPKRDTSHFGISLPWLIALMVAYALFFGAIAVLRHLNFQDASSFDVALYNQIQWNNIHGRFYQSSISGSNFVTHNSPFLILISPFYAIYPHPGTLLIIKTIFLTASAIPYYFLLRRFVSRHAIGPLLIGYLFYPYIIGQQFNAPHEVCFLPPFLLLALYFFLTSRFYLFLGFLFLCLSVKEHMAMIAVMFGLYAFLLKRSRRWIVVPIVSGGAWAVFSFWIMHHFQQIYTVDPYPAWLIDNIKGRFLRPGYAMGENFIWGMRTSVMGNAHAAAFAYPIFAAVGLIFPFLSCISLLGLPELAINFVANLPLFYPDWHYNIVVGCFFMVGCAHSIGRLPTRFHFGLPAVKMQQLCAWLICLCVLSHSFLWLDYLQMKSQPVYLADMKEAIDLIPENASVSAPKHLVSHVSTRDHYFLLQDERKGDYILIDQDKVIEDPIMSFGKIFHYERIFEKNGVSLYKKIMMSVGPSTSYGK